MKRDLNFGVVKAIITPTDGHKIIIEAMEKKTRSELWLKAIKVVEKRKLDVIKVELEMNDGNNP